MSFIKLDGLDVGFPFGSLEGAILQNNPDALRDLLAEEHNRYYGGHQARTIAAWEGLCTPTTDALPTLDFTLPRWPQPGVTVRRIGTGQWGFVFGNSTLFAATAQVVNPGSIGSGATAYVVANVVSGYADSQFYSFEVHTVQGTYSTLAYADLPFVLAVYK